MQAFASQHIIEMQVKIKFFKFTNASYTEVYITIYQRLENVKTFYQHQDQDQDRDFFSKTKTDPQAQDQDNLS